MTQIDVELYLRSLDNVQQSEAYGYQFFFVGEDHRMPFVTIANSDQDFDNASNLSRESVFRVNIGISKPTFDALIAEPDPRKVDLTELNLFLPHPDYAKQYFVCILSPTGGNEMATKRLILEAHGIAVTRLERVRKQASS